jgi:hypothetical protein
MGRVSGMQRWVLTAALFAGALVLLVVAIFTHSAVPLFVMWAPLLTVPLVLGRADPGLRRLQGGGSPEAKPAAEAPEATDTTETNQASDQN